MWGIVTVILALVFVAPVFAQSTADFYQKTQTAGNSYRQSYSAYTTAKNQHLKYHTGSTRIEAITKTNDVLLKRNEWEANYLSYVRSLLADVTNIGNYTQTVSYLDLENKISILNDQTKIVGSGTTFSEVNSNALAWEKILEGTTKLAEVAQVQIATTRITNLEKELSDLLAQYQNQISTPSSDQLITINLISQKSSEAKSTLAAVNSALAQYKSGSWSKNNQVSQLQTVQASLLDAAKLLRELQRSK